MTQRLSKKTSVIIPALNEGSTIGDVVRIAKADCSVEEVIVVDDKSFDDTVQNAQKAGASVITSTKLGKGASMRDGLLVSSGEVVVFLDADVNNYRAGIVGALSEKIINDEFDFIKGRFSRAAGRVTELVAKPLLALLFPELSRFAQPLGGIIAGRRDLLIKIEFENDYGVDIGLLIDMYQLGARIGEVDIGPLEHKMKPWHQLTRMSLEVSRAILRRANDLSVARLENLETISLISDQMEHAIQETVKAMKKMVVFDLDNTILEGRFIEYAAKAFDFSRDLADIISKNQDSYLITKLIARLLAGKSIADLLRVADSIPLVADVKDVIAELHGRGYIVGIITDSYDCIANHIKNKLNTDFIMANELEFSSGIATGEVKVPSYFCRTDASACNHNFCKSNALLHASDQHKINLSNIIAIGDGENDICMVRSAGIGVAFCSPNKLLNQIADYVLPERSFNPILKFAQ